MRPVIIVAFGDDFQIFMKDYEFRLCFTGGLRITHDLVAALDLLAASQEDREQT